METLDSFQRSLVSLPLQTCRCNRDLWTDGSEIGNLLQPGMVCIKAGPDKRWLLLLLSGKRLLMRYSMKLSYSIFKDFLPNGIPLNRAFFILNFEFSTNSIFMMLHKF